MTPVPAVTSSGRVRGLAAALILASAPAHGRSVADWRADLDEIATQVRATHPDAFARTGHLAFTREAAALKAALPALTEEQRMVGAMRLVARLGDTHTQLEPNRADFALWYPIRIYEFSDGIFVTGAHTSVAELAGARILEVAGLPVDQVVAEARALMGADNLLSAKEGLFAFSSVPLMRGLGYAAADGGLALKVRLAGGAIASRVLAPHRSDDPRYAKDDSSFEWHFQAEMGGPPFGGPEQWISAFQGLRYAAFRTTDPARPPRLINRRGFVAHPLAGGAAFLIQANSVGDDFDRQFIDALREVDRARPQRLIVDLRYNFGGDGSRVPAVAREFVKRADAPPWKELYVVTGRRTLSAGIMAAVAILQSGAECTVVGEPMAAPVNSYGDPISIPLPRSGMLLSLSTVRHVLGDPHDVSEYSPVDVPVEMSFSDYAAGRDPALDPILRGEEMRSLAVIALHDGGAAARRVHDARKARFARFSWWAPPAELELRAVTQTLLGQQRVEDAVEVGTLTAELHPEVWNSWYNLGVAQRAAGNAKAALASWRRVLELDPENPNGDEIRRAIAAP